MGQLTKTQVIDTVLSKEPNSHFYPNIQEGKLDYPSYYDLSKNLANRYGQDFDSRLMDAIRYRQAHPEIKWKTRLLAHSITSPNPIYSTQYSPSTNDTFFAGRTYLSKNGTVSTINTNPRNDILASTHHEVTHQMQDGGDESWGDYPLSMKEVESRMPLMIYQSKSANPEVVLQKYGFINDRILSSRGVGKMNEDSIPYTIQLFRNEYLKLKRENPVKAGKVLQYFREHLPGMAQNESNTTG